MTALSWIQIYILIMLPAVVVQARYMIYMRTKSKSRRDLAAGLIEVLPHDLSIMGLTLAFTVLPSWMEATSSNQKLFFMVAIILPLFVTASIPLVEDRRLRFAAGCVAYLVGAFTYYFSRMP